MMRAGRIPVMATVLIGVLCPTAHALAAERPAIAEQIAKAYGLDSFAQVDAVRFTFNIQAGSFKVSRSWVWEPKANRISYDGPDGAGKPVKVSYSRGELASQSAFVKETVDPAFSNDSYWLLLPFHLVWDTAATLTDEGMQKVPHGKGKARKVVLKYPSDGGYTPGDTWELYVGTDNRILEMVFHHGGSAKPKLVTATWVDYKMAGPLLVSLDHRGTADGHPLRVNFSNVAVRTAGSSTWMEAK